MKLGRLISQVSLVMVLGVAVLGSTLAIASRTDDYAFFDPMIEIKTMLNRLYVEEIDDRELQDGAIAGMLETLGDPYTFYVPTDDQADFEKELTGEYVGIGAQVVVEDGWLTIVTPLEDSPAFRAGIMADDRVIRIDGESTWGLTADECVDRLTGEEGTPVDIVVERAGEEIPYTLVRAQIVTRIVKGFEREGDAWNFMIDPERQVAYIRLTQFTPGCAAPFAEALEAVGAADGTLGGLVIDLRWNPGGVLSDAVAIADMFLDEGIIVSTRGRNRPEEVARARQAGILPDFAVVVLVNGQSASASEVLAGALVDNDRAVVVGTRSFGKGSVQTVRNLPSGTGVLKITEQGYYLPSGRSIHRKDDSITWGVDPSEGFHVPLTNDELRDLIEVRRREDVIRPEDGAGAANWSDPDWIVHDLKDPQLAAAVHAVQLRVDQGTWVPTGQPGITGEDLLAREYLDNERLRERLLRELSRLDRRQETIRTAADLEETEPVDLIPDGVALRDGRLEVYDAAGTLVVSLRLTDGDLERWLMDAGVEKID
ncbi:MAG: S41 family peptidase [Phycisphaerales bacterium]|nr:S41 family peptidase [Phycisphaerales bacterium]